jgi:hypothetical protein
MMVNEFVGYVASAYPILWIDTHEYDRAIKNYTEELEKGKTKYNIATWDIVSGISKYNGDRFVSASDPNGDPSQPIDFLLKDSGPAVMFVKDYHMYIETIEVWRSLINSINNFKQNAKIFVIISPKVNIPEEINKIELIDDYANVCELKKLINKLEIAVDNDCIKPAVS